MLIGGFRMSSQTKKPESFPQFLFMLVKGFITGLPKLIARNIIKIVIMAVAILILHTYLLVDLNEGFWFDPNNRLSGMINVRNANTGSITFWAVSMFFVTQLWRRSRIKGIKQTLGEVITLPVWLGSCIKNSGKARFIALSVGAALAILVSIFITNNWTILVFALLTALSFSSRMQSLLLMAVNLAISDFNKIFRRKAIQKSPSVATTSLIIAGLSLGFIASLFIPQILWARVIAIVLLLVLSVLQIKGIMSPKVAAGFLIFSGMQLVLLRFNIAFADDGGLSEAGGTWRSWIGSPGAGTAVKMGVPPAGAGTAGALVGTFTGEFISQVDFGFEGQEPDVGVVPPVVPFEPYGESPAEELPPIVPDKPEVEPGDVDLENLSSEEQAELIKKIQEALKNQTEDAEKMQDAIEKTLSEKAMEELKKILIGPDNVPPDKMPPGYAEWAKEMLGAGFIQDFLKGGAKETFNTCFEQLKQLYNSNLDGTALGDLIKQDIFNDLKGAAKYKSWANTMDNTLKYGGAIMDALDWYGKGDSALDAAIKGFGNAELMSYIGTKVPAMGIMEFANFVAFGGTEAANVISPGKTITGTTNYIYDMITKDPKVLEERMRNGDYGPNVKNFVDGNRIINDAIKDPEDFKRAWNEFATINEEGGSDSFTDMYKTSEDLWKVPEGTHDYSPRRLFSWIGKKTTDGVIAAGETAGRTGSWLGRATSNWF
jgi:hypothetical protein